jgi:hypothetical protein
MEQGGSVTAADRSKSSNAASTYPNSSASMSDNPPWLHRYDAKPSVVGWYPVLMAWDLGERLPDAMRWDGTWGNLWFAVSHFINRPFSAEDQAKAYAAQRLADYKYFG